MADNEQPETISQERYNAVVRERDSLKGQVEESKDSLTDYQKRDAARTALKGKVADVDVVADMITPFLTEVSLEDIGSHVSSDEFKPRLNAFAPAATPSTSTGGDGEATSESGTVDAAVEETGGFGGPSPGGADGTKALDSKTDKIATNSPEYQEAIRTDNTEQIEKWDKAGQLETPARPWT